MSMREPGNLAILSTSCVRAKGALWQRFGRRNACAARHELATRLATRTGPRPTMQPPSVNAATIRVRLPASNRSALVGSRRSPWSRGRTRPAISHGASADRREGDGGERGHTPAADAPQARSPHASAVTHTQATRCRRRRDPLSRVDARSPPTADFGCEVSSTRPLTPRASWRTPRMYDHRPPVAKWCQRIAL
ncbi:hypothetical protein JB92DRAFT_2837900 [Gautieria morchelliformis]|nr:hypothetical protein JB92DRAFT_2837900 [Gautieria morchelliformis]